MLSQTLAKFIRNTSYDDLPEEVVDFTKMCILDWAGSAIAGKDKAPIEKIANLIEEMGAIHNPPLLMERQRQHCKLPW
ncbi:MmgE/PrpD family protein [Halobacillus shinanisalinarum]|uniref:MmgE/PrpD family protein n=1 Tax=Halobacillus shinanisalinarum TaxID=2932258 RepID=A0ABY4H358_9BACI|nr:MmgE/PrpD family protein [Halobacillus shinanisalinarum]UOQ94887.1 MmgE/PrpD family protein [Halobacillus shinanisalinarum]